MFYLLLLALGCSEYWITDNNKGPDEPMSDTDTAAPDSGDPTDTDTSAGSDTATDTDTDTDTGVDEQDLCETAAEITGYLDDFQTADDGKVIFCHSGSGNSYNLLDTDISACTSHLDHPHDVFPTTGCDS